MLRKWGILSKIALGILVLAGGLAAVLAATTLTTGSVQISVAPVPRLVLDKAAEAEKLSGAVRIPTISSDDGARDPAAFLAFQAYLRRQFPLVYSRLTTETVNSLSLLYTWRGSDPALSPILLLAHHDVVPVAAGTEAQWTYPPFSGKVADGFVWGRGAWDNKGNLVSMLEALELLIQQGFQPRRTIYLASGHDEETGTLAGQQGAKRIAQHLREQGVRLEAVIDEGLLVTERITKGIDKPVALIGIAEKGYVTLKLTADGEPGHSSLPEPGNVIGRLSSALAKLDRNPFPASFNAVVGQMFRVLAPEYGGVNRVALSNLWLLGPVVQAMMEEQPSTSAMLRTTTALTVFQSGNKENVIPGHAEAKVNFRTAPGMTTDDVVAHVKAVIADPGIAVAVGDNPREASKVASTQSRFYGTLQQSIAQVFPSSLVAPGLLMATTDSHYFEDLANDIYLFSPVRATAADLARFHGTNERISLDNLAEMIEFYYRLLENVSGS